MFLDILNIALDLCKFLKIPKKPQNILNIQSNLEQKSKVSARADTCAEVLMQKLACEGNVANLEQIIGGSFETGEE